MARRVRIAIVGASPCEGCGANCCRQNGHEFAVLLRGEEVRRFAAFSVQASFNREGRKVLERVLPYVKGRCQFLDEEERCRIYEDRPMACREFECVRFYNVGGLGRHGRFLELNPEVCRRLEEMAADVT